MLSPTSLAAFSPAGLPPVSHAPVQRVRATGAVATTVPPAAAPPAAPAVKTDSANPPPRTLPRGSLLDLSV